MSENLIPSCSTAEINPEKVLINAATQHGNANNADEENIVVLSLSHSPKRETDDAVVWHEDFEDPSIKKVEAVSTDSIHLLLLFILINKILILIKFQIILVCAPLKVFLDCILN